MPWDFKDLLTPAENTLTWKWPRNKKEKPGRRKEETEQSGQRARDRRRLGRFSQNTPLKAFEDKDVHSCDEDRDAVQFYWYQEQLKMTKSSAPIIRNVLITLRSVGSHCVSKRRDYTALESWGQALEEDSDDKIHSCQCSVFIQYHHRKANHERSHDHCFNLSSEDSIPCLDRVGEVRGTSLPLGSVLLK